MNSRRKSNIYDYTNDPSYLVCGMLKRPWIALVRRQIDRVAMLSSTSGREAASLPNFDIYHPHLPV